MLITADIELPPRVRERLKARAAFADSYGHYTRRRLLGFEQPVARAAAFAMPVLIAIAYVSEDIVAAGRVGAIFAFATALILTAAWIANRRQLADGYRRTTDLRRTAKADLKAGRGTDMSLTLRQGALFFEHKQGVIVFADAGEGKTVFFDIRSDADDPRWFLFLNGDLHRQHWSWIRLECSGAVADFTAAGCRTPHFMPPRDIAASDAWEAISLALGDPADGDLIDMPVAEVEQTVNRLL